MNKKSQYDRRHKSLARSLCNRAPAEIPLLNDVLKGKRFYGYQFNRQFSLDRYIVDYICRRLKLIIEI